MQPAWSAALASWIWRMSFCVIVSSRLAVGEDVREGAAVGDDPRRAGRERAVDRAVGREHAGEVELGDRLDDPRAADARHVRAGERRLVRPDRRCRSRGSAARASPGRSARARSRPGAARWPQLICAPSNAGPGRARRREQPVAVAEHDLGVRADVDDQVHLVAEVRRLGEDHARRVGADVTRDARQHVRARAGVDREAELAPPAGAPPRRSRARTARRRAPSGRARAGGGA